MAGDGTAWTLLLMPYGRVGSNLCMSVIAQSGAVRPFNEPLTVIHNANLHLPRPEVWALQKKWLKRHVAGDAGPPRAVVNLAASTLAATSAFLRFLDRNPAEIVRLDRRSDLRTAISRLRGEVYAGETERRTGKEIWGLEAGGRWDDRPVIDPERLKQTIETIRRGRRRVERIVGGRDVPVFWYEDLEADLPAYMDRLLATLGIPPFAYRVRFAKFTPLAIEAAVANPDEVLRTAEALAAS